MIHLYIQSINLFSFTPGTIFYEYWKREEERLAEQFHTKNFVVVESSRVEYSKKLEEYRIKVNDPHAQFPAYQKYLKYVASFLVTMFFVTIFPLFKSLKKSILFFIKMGIVALDIAAFIIFRM